MFTFYVYYLFGVGIASPFQLHVTHALKTVTLSQFIRDNLFEKIDLI